MTVRDQDLVWKALADSTRREILDLLRDGPRQTTEIVAQFPELSRFGVMKHLDVLRAADLIRTRSEGRLRVNSLNVAPLRDGIERWISKYEAYWANTLLRVKEAAESAVEETEATATSERKSKRKGA
ncbi:helix-turn-helix domain-containing protein [bacterium]|nr:helix-turn-helix domain-containing protein [bacterium]